MSREKEDREMAFRWAVGSIPYWLLVTFVSALAFSGMVSNLVNNIPPTDSQWLDFRIMFGGMLVAGTIYLIWMWHLAKKHV